MLNNRNLDSFLSFRRLYAQAADSLAKSESERSAWNQNARWRKVFGSIAMLYFWPALTIGHLITARDNARFAPRQIPENLVTQA
jgi:hypothetical protein